MSYIRPSASAADLSWSAESPFTRPSASAANLTFPADTYTGDGAVTLDIVAAAEGEHSGLTIEGDGAVTLGFTPASDGTHGLAGDGTLSLSVDPAASGVHGVAGDGAATFTFTPACSGTHERYEVRGEVRVSGVLVDRQVRAHRRDTGEMVGEAATVAGKFHIHTGFVAREHYVVPIHLDSGATDWSPPTANRVVSVLAQDA